MVAEAKTTKGLGPRTHRTSPAVMALTAMSPDLTLGAGHINRGLTCQHHNCAGDVEAPW
jgi:hypothetical protein